MASLKKLTKRQYPHSDKLQPRFAAYLLSRGLPISPDADLPNGWQPDFMAWVQKAKRWASRHGRGVFERPNLGTVREIFVSDHDEFTAACWDFAVAREA